MWKWLFRRQYKIVERVHTKGIQSKYYTAEYSSLWGRGYIDILNRWSSCAFSSAMKYNTIADAEKGIQCAIWKRAFEIKQDLSKRTKATKTIKVPPWGNT